MSRLVIVTVGSRHAEPSENCTYPEISKGIWAAAGAIARPIKTMDVIMECMGCMWFIFLGEYWVCIDSNIYYFS